MTQTICPTCGTICTARWPNLSHQRLPLDAFAPYDLRFKPEPGPVMRQPTQVPSRSSLAALLDG